jgi:hypothetical protein
VTRAAEAMFVENVRKGEDMNGSVPVAMLWIGLIGSGLHRQLPSAGLGQRPPRHGDGARRARPPRIARRSLLRRRALAPCPWRFDRGAGEACPTAQMQARRGIWQSQPNQVCCTDGLSDLGKELADRARIKFYAFVEIELVVARADAAGVNIVAITAFCGGVLPSKRRRLAAVASSSLATCLHVCCSR